MTRTTVFVPALHVPWQGLMAGMRISAQATVQIDRLSIIGLKILKWTDLTI